MANTPAWDRVPVYGWYYKSPGVPDNGPKATVQFKITGAPNGVKRVDGRAIYRAGATHTVEIGKVEDQDSEVRALIHDALRARDEALLGGDFDGIAWEAAWSDALPAFVCTSFYPKDDPDMTPQGFQIEVKETLPGGGGKTFPLDLTMAMISAEPLPGLNLADVEVPPGAPTTPAPTYAKGQPGGVAPLDEHGKVPLANLPDDIGGGELSDIGLASILNNAESSSRSAVLDIVSEVGSGADGREVQLQTSATHVQWRYAGDSEWANLVPLADLKGEPGDTGPAGPTAVSEDAGNTAVLGTDDLLYVPAPNLSGYVATSALDAAVTALVVDGDTDLYGALTGPISDIAEAVENKLDSVTYENVPAGMPVVAYWDESWPDRPTARANIPVWWVDDTGTHGTPAGFLPADFLVHPGEVDAPPAVVPWETLDFEGQAHDTALSSLPAGWSITGSLGAVAHSGAAVHGTLGLRLPNITTSYVLDFEDAQLKSADVVIDFYFTLRALSANLQLVTVRDTSSGIVSNWRVLPGGTVNIRNANTSVGTSTEVLAVDTLYRASYLMTDTTQSLRIFEGEATTPLFTLNGAVASSDRHQVRIGASTASSGSSVDIDTIRFADDWLAPVGGA